MTHFTELVAIAVARPDGGVTIRRIPARASEDCYDQRTADNMGFTLADGVWSREITDALVEADLDKCGIARVSWRRVKEIDLPERALRAAWVDAGKAIGIDPPKAREIAHKVRREKREAELAPLDKQINIDIADPAKVAAVEVKRKIIREKYAVMQVEIDKAETLDILKTILE